ncbi:hypothetical protein SeMB42_g06251 [Synchytrium endobioticum]|uniref:ADP-ribosylation factor-like protein 2-binding protein n=1 Tax=Synchytrium endobioticum TaxID=286115 RepID=A0A507D7I0_9FUNG|nr:hypothetical protein SeMB42_g06251 [Synchytrium endobioticum]TPX46790.1 hypothetical protein SeLEV6574_g03036 [Synchytrium endobioticum]
MSKCGTTTVVDVTSAPGIMDDDYVAGSQTVEDERFDAVIGHLEDILVGDDFARFEETFNNSYGPTFQTSPAKKTPAQTDAFNIWKEQVKHFVAPRITAALSWFDFDEFLVSLKSHPELDGDVFDFLATLSSLDAFKEKMSENEQPANKEVDFSDLLAIRPARR